MSTVRQVMRTLQYPGSSWWQLGAAGVEDEERKRSLRESLGRNNESLGTSILRPFSAPAGQCLLIVLRSASTFSVGLFLTCQARLYRSQIKCLWCLHDGEYSCKNERDLSIIWTKGKDLIERKRVKISKRRGNWWGEVPKKERGVESRIQVKG